MLVAIHKTKTGAAARFNTDYLESPRNPYMTSFTQV